MVGHTMVPFSGVSKLDCARSSSPLLVLVAAIRCGCGMVHPGLMNLVLPFVVVVDLVVVNLLTPRLPSVLLVVMMLGLLDVSLLGFGSTPDVHHQRESLVPFMNISLARCLNLSRR